MLLPSGFTNHEAVAQGCAVTWVVEVAEATGWEPSKGDFQLHWESKPAGSKCLFSCRFHTASGILESDSYMPIRLLRSFELIAEAQDIVAPMINFVGVMQPNLGVIEREIVPVIEKYEAGGINFLDDLIRGLTRIRGAYSEFIFPFDPPAHSFMVLVRPGWGSRAEISAAMENLRSDRIPLP